MRISGEAGSSIHGAWSKTAIRSLPWRIGNRAEWTSRGDTSSDGPRRTPTPASCCSWRPATGSRSDITEHPDQGGQCLLLRRARRLLAFGCRLVGRKHPDHRPGDNSLGMATACRERAEGLVIHSDRGVQCTSRGFSRKVRDAGIAPRWEPSAARTKMRWSSHWGRICRSRSSTANARRPGSSSPTRFTTTSSSSTTPVAGTRRSGCSRRPNTRIYTTQPWSPDSRNPTPFFRGRSTCRSNRGQTRLRKSPSSSGAYECCRITRWASRHPARRSRALSWQRLTIYS